MKAKWRALSLSVLASLVGAGAACHGDGPEALERKAAWAAEAFPAPTITQGEVRAMLEANGDSRPLLVDVRAPKEYATSHLPGAINWADYKHGEVPAAVADHARAGKPVVFYCSIGYRSGEATMNARQTLGEDARVYNLRGGIFQWANEGGALEGGPRVHGYNEDWGVLLRDEVRAPADEAP